MKYKFIPQRKLYVYRAANKKRRVVQVQTVEENEKCLERQKRNTEMARRAQIRIWIPKCKGCGCKKRVCYEHTCD